MPKRKTAHPEFDFDTQLPDAPAVSLATLEPQTATALASDIMSCLSSLGDLDPVPSTGDLADELGELQAKLADLSAQEQKLKSKLSTLLNGQGVCEGKLFRCTVSTYDKNSTDWKGIAEAVGYSTQMKSAHTEKKRATTVKVVARKAHP